MSLLRRKRLVRFDTQEATFSERPECEILTRCSHPPRKKSVNSTAHSLMKLPCHLRARFSF
jgi:hypothetical protein